MAGTYRRRGTLGVESGENLHPQPFPSQTVNEERSHYRPKRQTTTRRTSQPPEITATPTPTPDWYNPGPETFNSDMYDEVERGGTNTNALGAGFNSNGSGWPYGPIQQSAHPGPEGPLTPGPGQPSPGTQDPGETAIVPQNYPNRPPAQPPGGPPGDSSQGGSPSSPSGPDQSMIPDGDGEGQILGGEGFRPEDGDGKRRDDMVNWNTDKKNSKSAKSGKYFVIIRYKYSKTCSVFTTEKGRKRRPTL